MNIMKMKQLMQKKNAAEQDAAMTKHVKDHLVLAEQQVLY